LYNRTPQYSIRNYKRYKKETGVEAVMAIGDGYKKFYSGMAEGIDLLFVEILSDLRNTSFSDIIIEGVIPYRGRLKTKCEGFQKLVKCCDIVHVICEPYHTGAYHKRNRFMVDNSMRVIAVYDGRTTGGTFYTLNYAKIHQRELRIIPI
jgi:uncharacterized phage-like protein YoqJ